jgi:microcystin-dependent protein
MPDYYIGEVRMFSFDYVPEDWAPCDGQLLPVAQNRELAQPLGTRYGGNGQETFGLPDLRDRAAIQAPGHAAEPYLAVMFCIAINGLYPPGVG